MSETDHKDVTKQLEEIGLTSHEASLYLEILRNGEASVGILLQHVKLHREQAYRALKRLEEAGLIRKYEKRKRAYFAITNTDLLIERVKERVQVAETIQPILKSLHQRQPHVVRVVDGPESFAILLKDCLDTLKRDSEYLILGGQGQTFERLEEVWTLYEKYVKIFAKRNIKLRMLAFEGEDFSSQLRVQELLEIRELPGSYIGPVATVIYANKVALEVMDPENISIVMIENKKIAESYKQQFEALWKLGKLISKHA